MLTLPLALLLANALEQVIQQHDQRGKNYRVDRNDAGAVSTVNNHRGSPFCPIRRLVSYALDVYGTRTAYLSGARFGY